MAISPEQAIDAINEVFGRQGVGHRALHAKGTLCLGTFTATPAAAKLTRAVPMRGGPTPATIRLSNASGDPNVADYLPDPRGLAIKLYLPDGTRTDIVAVSSPRFPARTPEGFIELVRAQGAGPAAIWKLPRFLATHPQAVRGLPANIPTLMPPPSYASLPYYGIHAFRWVNAEGAERYVRYELLPQSAAGKLTPWEAKRRGRDYLQQELRARLARGPISFELEFQIATPGDPIDDPTASWPKHRQRVRAGRLEITGLETERETGDDVVVFDPTRVTDGIECSADPILQFRAGAYSASVARRMPSA